MAFHLLIRRRSTNVVLPNTAGIFSFQFLTSVPDDWKHSYPIQMQDSFSENSEHFAAPFFWISLIPSFFLFLFYHLDCPLADVGLNISQQPSCWVSLLLFFFRVVIFYIWNEIFFCEDFYKISLRSFVHVLFDHPLSCTFDILLSAVSLCTLHAGHFLAFPLSPFIAREWVLFST